MRNPLTFRSLRLLLVPVVVLLALAHATPARADVIGAAEIEDYHQLRRDFLGDAVGPAKTLAGGVAGAKRMYQRGAIFWSETTGPVMLLATSLPKYQALGAETSILGLPTEDSNLAYVEFEHGVICDNHLVNGVLLDEWTKNGRERGPLGDPLDDSAITYIYVNVNGIPFALLSSATQHFVGATINYGRFPLPGGWSAQVNPQARTHVRVQIPFTMRVHDATCATTRIDQSLWANLPIGFPYPFAFRAPWCGSGSHKLQALFHVSLQNDSGGAATTLEVGPFESMWIASDDPNSAGPSFFDGHHLHLPLGMEVTQNIDHLISATNGDSLDVDRFTVRSTSVSTADIVF